MQKETRWYEVDGETLFVYDHPDPRQAQSLSFTKLSDLAYYRKMFRLRKVEVPLAASHS